VSWIAGTAGERGSVASSPDRLDFRRSGDLGLRV
jgi:hypothetical protein